MKVLTICLLMLGIAAGCKKSSNPGQPELAGNYKVSGTIVTQTYPCWPCLDSIAPSYQTSAFDTTIQVVHVNTDTFRLYGLDYTGMMTMDGPDCQPFQSYCGFFAIGQADSLIWITINDDPGGYNTGGALIKGDSAYFTYYYSWRNIFRTYSLSGRRQ
jgi:hypothetical protein